MVDINDLRYKVLAEAQKVLAQNKECFMALWAMQQWAENPKIDFSKYTMCWQPAWYSKDGIEKFWMEEKV